MKNHQKESIVSEIISLQDKDHNYFGIIQQYHSLMNLKFEHVPDIMVKHPFNLPEGKRVWFKDDQGRKVIVIVTRYGNVCIYERLPNKHIVRAIGPEEVNIITMGVMGTSLSNQQVLKFVGNDFVNLGTEIERIASLFQPKLRKGKIGFGGNVVDIQYYFDSEDTISFELNGTKYTTSYKSLVN